MNRIGKVGKDGIQEPCPSFNFDQVATFLERQPNWYWGGSEGTSSPTSVAKVEKNFNYIDMASKVNIFSRPVGIIERKEIDRDYQEIRQMRNNVNVMNRNLGRANESTLSTSRR